MSPYSGDTGARCKRCLQEFEESEVDVVNVSPATELADIFLRDIGVEDINDLCPPMQGGTWCDGSAGVWGVGIGDGFTLSYSRKIPTKSILRMLLFT